MIKNARSILLFLFWLLAVGRTCGSGGIADINADGYVDLGDLINLTQCWLESELTGLCQSLNFHPDDLIDYQDFSVFSQAWMSEDLSWGLVGRWNMDETDGLYAYDSSGNNHHGVLQNFSASPWKNGWINNALEFDGVNDYIQLYQQDNGLGQYFTRDFTIAVWLYPTNNNGYQVVFGVESTSRYVNSGFEGFTLELNGGLPSIYIAFPDPIGNPYPDMNRSIVPGNTPLVLNQWHHLCIVRDGPQVRLYFDGQLDAVGEVPNEDIYFGSDYPGWDAIGAAWDSYYGVNDYFHGKIDQLHLYNTAVSESVVRKLASQYLAWLPQPADQAMDVSTGSILKWQKGILAQRRGGHDVYLGKDFHAVDAATPETPEIYKGRQTAVTFDPQGLDPFSEYFWRIDEFDGTQTHKGEVWSFITSDKSFTTRCSSFQTGYPSAAAVRGENRFDFGVNQCWKGQANQDGWWWQIDFSEPAQIGSILQIVGDHPNSVLENAPLDYCWQWSQDGLQWTDLPEIAVSKERRLYRIHRLSAPVSVRHLRIRIDSCIGSFPVLREIELYPETDAEISFPDWVIAVSITENDTLPAYYVDNFIDLIADCPGRGSVQAQEIWLGDFDESYLAIEPYPLCAFLSGSFLDWCQRTREPFAGLQEVLQNENLPIWGSCGGAQAIGILLDTGWQSPWDCPRCRNPEYPYSPIYGHIGYIDPLSPRPCGVWDNSLAEIGPTYVRKVVEDPAFAELPSQFRVNQSHMGQLEYLPMGWEQVCGAGDGALTEIQCFKKIGKPIYGAQFHIENYHVQTQVNSIIIMNNFLTIAKQWGGYRAN